MQTLQDMLREKGRRQKDLAEALDVSEPSVSRWAKREVDIPTRHIASIAAFLDVEASDVLAVAVSYDATFSRANHSSVNGGVE